MVALPLLYAWHNQGGAFQAPVTTDWTKFTLPISFTEWKMVPLASIGATNGIVNIYGDSLSSFQYKALGQWNGTNPLHYIVFGM